VSSRTRPALTRRVHGKLAVHPPGHPLRAGRAVTVALTVALLGLGGCGFAETHHNPGNSHDTATAAPAYDSDGTPVGATLTITVAGRTVTPTPGRVEVRQGERVRLLVTADHADTLHVHGVDVTADLTAGVQTTVVFTAGDPGVHEVETHDSELVLTQLAVR
jgi:heme/copper-type cytochrome/quinol oxidase subunit 2